MSVIRKIEKLEDNIARHEGRLDTIDRALRLSHLTDKKRSQLEEEEKQLQEELEGYRKTTSSLRFDNFKSMIVSVLLLGAIYVLYILVT